MLESCHSTKDWVERRKRKQLIKKELNNIDLTLGLINAEGELIHERWKEFKASRCITNASMNVLLEHPGEQYFAQAKQLKSKNKTCAQISPAAAEFFRVFLKHKSGFEKPVAQAEYRTYNVQRNTFSDRRAGTWDSNTMNHIGLGVMNLCELLGVETTMVEPGKRPYFYSVIGSMEDTRRPFVGKIDNWLIISATESHEKQQTLDYTNAHEWFRHLHCNMADYILARCERLGDASVAQAPKRVMLQFFQNSEARRPVPILDEFYAPNTPVFNKPHGYSELEYQVYLTELRMEFYLWLVKKFIKAGDSVFSMWGGGKLICAAMVRFESARLELILIPPFFVLISLTSLFNLVMCVIRSTPSDARYSTVLICTPMPMYANDLQKCLGAWRGS